jgi:hypothetical protein
MFGPLKNFFAKAGEKRGSPPTPVEAHSPYGRQDLDLIYNVLFCDDPSLYRMTGGQPAPWQILLDDDSHAGAVRAFAVEETQESRVRCLAFNWLRRNHQPVPKGLLLGTIVEVGLAAGLDVIAAFEDGRVRYINHIGKLAVFEATPPDVGAGAKHLIEVSQPVIERIGPWEKPRRPPPPKGSVRMTFLVSDGLYFGEGPISSIQSDPLAGPVYAGALRLLQLVTAASTKETRL